MYYQTIANGLRHAEFRRYRHCYPAWGSFMTMAMTGVKPEWFKHEEARMPQRLDRCHRARTVRTDGV